MTKLPLGEIENPNWHAVKNGPRGPRGDQLPCVVCGRGVSPSKAKWVRLDFNDATLVPFSGEYTRTAWDDPSIEPIGPDCAKRLQSTLQGFIWPKESA